MSRSFAVWTDDEALLSLARALFAGRPASGAVLAASHAWGCTAALRGRVSEGASEARREIEAVHLEASCRNRLAIEHAAAVCAVAPSARVTKGGALVVHAIRTAGERPMDDVDVWVHEGDSGAACSTLRGRGLRPIERVRHDGRTADPARAPGATWTDDAGTTVDVHVRRAPLGGCEHVRWQGLDLRAQCRAELFDALSRHVIDRHAAGPRAWMRHLLDADALVRAGCGEAGSAAGRSTLEALARLRVAIDRDDAAAVREALTPLPAPRLTRGRRVLRRAAAIVAEDPRLLLWALMPHPAYVRARTPAHSAEDLARAYLVRALGRRWHPRS